MKCWRPWILLILLLCACGADTTPARRLDQGMDLMKSLLASGDLHAAVRGTGEQGVRPSTVVAFLFSASGAGFWPVQSEVEGEVPGPRVPEGVEFRRDRPDGPMQVVAVPDDEAGLVRIEAYLEAGSPPVSTDILRL